jgi:serine protease AprX
VSGLVALILEEHPSATPDQVKMLLMETAYKLKLAEGRVEQGRGLVDGAEARDSKLPKDKEQKFDPAVGTGSLEAARGSMHVSDGVSVLEGEQDIFGQAWDGIRWSELAGAGTSWNGGEWNGSRWSGDTWTGSRWSGVNWTGSRWSGASWTGSRWSGASWTGSRWSGVNWTGSRWSGVTWTGSRWSGSRWSGGEWS